MPESGTSGSVRGVSGNGHLYRDWLVGCRITEIRLVSLPLS